MARRKMGKFELANDLGLSWRVGLLPLVRMLVTALVDGCTVSWHNPVTGRSVTSRYLGG